MTIKISFFFFFETNKNSKHIKKVFLCMKVLILIKNLTTFVYNRMC